ncbi:Histone acetyltransferase [Pleurostoma richardsiae]|uniref:Histone acetyltransferase n=1 Tax=Pleurostoma richardsiae TaxID=41990 RepID=A0AA38VHF2_9PEZI|nr:Histone acetyltransferase [Pleurostoma richardsiae]
MASAQLMEEELQQELQQSVMVSEEDADFDEYDDDGGVVETQDAPDGDMDLAGPEDGGDHNHEHMPIEEGSIEDDRDDEEGDADDDDNFEDAEGEDDDILDHSRTGKEVPVVDESEDDDEDVEGVGAVKIKPGETDEEDEDSEGEASAAASNDDSDDDAEWEEAAENVDEDDEESDSAAPNTCIFCRQNEDNDPGEEFEAFLTCSGCGEHAHQQCAREHNIFQDNQDLDTWKCLECRTDFESGSVANELGADTTADGHSPPSTRRSTAPKLARDLLPSQRGAIKPDSHSVFNQLVLDEDPMDGSRVLRKRKTSSADAEAEEHVMSLRKRRKTTVDDESNDGINGPDDDGRQQRARSLRLKISTNAPATVVRKSRSTLLVKFRVNPQDLKRISKSKPQKKRADRASSSRVSRPVVSRAAPPVAASIPTPFTSTAYTQPFYSFFDKDMDELKGKPYGGILTDVEADTSKTLPTNDDRRRFDEAKQKAEEEWRQRVIAMQAEMEAPIKKSKKAVGPASQIECIEFGGWEIDTWYAAPYPEEYSRNRVLYICEFCLKYMNSDYVAWRHKLKCPAKHPPGDEIYRHNSVSVFEVDGRKNPVYCQNLCLLAKLFLGSKTLYYDVEPFLFYVLCEYDDMGYHFVGYFSKEKRASSQNNVSCILTLPIHQRKGYGNLLIDFSYLLTRAEQKTGSPEKPLSDMGLVSYRNYWRLIMCRYLLDHVPESNAEKHGLSIRKISDDTGLTPDDVVSALEGLRCLVRDSQTGLYAFRVDLAYCREYVAKWDSKNYVKLDPSALTWTPYVMGRSNATNFELGLAMHAIAPREDEEEQKAAEAVAEALPNGETHVLYAGTNGVDHKHDMADGSTVMESTEPNETGGGDELAESSPKPVENGVSTNHPPSAGQPDEPSAEMSEEDWASPYLDIPPTRFSVYPPIRRLERSRSSFVQPSLPRTVSAPRPKVRRSTTGSARRPTAPKPKSSGGSRRKTGGTGRGPGRWPKGTKKSDYGNADSGPGLPPAWLAERARLAALDAARKEADDNGLKSDVEETVQVKAVDIKEAKSQVNGLATNGEGKGKASPRLTRSTSTADGDATMMDVDADGEEDA